MSDAVPGRIVTCPACGKGASMSASNRWRPFCSERCRLTDLGAWATESYRIAGKGPAPEGEPDEGEGQG